MIFWLSCLLSIQTSSLQNLLLKESSVTVMAGLKDTVMTPVYLSKKTTTLFLSLEGDSP